MSLSDCPLCPPLRPQRYQVVFDGEQEVSKYLKKDGHATATFANEDKYVGEYRNGKRHGRGVYTFANGACYDGEYVDGVKEGRGSFLTLDGGKYDGDWKADKREGEGTYTYASGDAYKGGWKNHQKHGFGTYTYASNGSSISGAWSNGQLMNGTWRMVDGSKFVGAWHKNIPSGAGLHTFANGNQSTGVYAIDRKEGYKWTTTASKVGAASDAPPAPVTADPLKVAQRFIEKCTLKVDHFEGIGRQLKVVEGAPNFRRIADQAVFACGQPTITGFKNVFEYAGEQFQCDKFVWINVRAEPIVYVNDASYIPRSRHALNEPMSLAGLGPAAAAKAADAPLLSPEQLATIETQLVSKLTHDISHRGNLHTFLKDTFAELPQDRKNIELSEEVLPNEEGAYSDAIRSVATVYERLVEDDGVDVEYHRLPLPSDRLPALADFDQIVQLIKAQDPSTGIVFNDQMGRGRATYGTILATLMRRTAEAVSGADERENAALGRTDIEGLDLPEYDDADPNYKLGQYSLIMRLVRALPSGEQVKAEVDDAIERCKVMHHAREAILACRDQLEKDVAAASARGDVNAEEDIQARRAFWTASARNLVERYAYLLLFQAYVKANVEAEYENQTFAQFIDSKPELIEIIGTRQAGPISEFKWQ